MVFTKAALAGTAIMSLIMALDSGLIAYDRVTKGPLITATGTAPETVRAGTDVLVIWDIDKRTSCPGESSRVWSGENGFQLTEPVQASGIPEGHAIYSIQTRIPRLAPPGKLFLSIVGQYTCPGEAPWHFKLGPVEMEVTE